MRTILLLCVVVMAMVVSAVSISRADVPNVISYQGRLTDAADVAATDGPYLIRFVIYDAESGGAEVWNSGYQTVQVSDGIFDVLLGAPPMPVISGTIVNDTMLYLGITVGTDPEMEPRTRLTSTPWTFKARNADVADLATTATNADMVDGQHASAFAASAHAHSYSPLGHGHKTDDIVSGTFGSDFFSAYDDLEAEGYLDNNAQSDLLTQLQLDSRFSRLSHTHSTYVDRYTNDYIYGTKNFSQWITADSGRVRIGQTTPIFVNDVNYESGASTGANIYLENRGGATTAGILVTMETDGGSGYGVTSTARSYTDGNTSGIRYAFNGYAKDASAVYGGRFRAEDGTYAYGAYGYASGPSLKYGVYGATSSSTANYGGYFYGNVRITGSTSKALGGMLIDHPLDPENQYLAHCDVESPEMKNVYDGVVTLDGVGRAVVELPKYFDALNESYRYQLTPIGAPAPNLHIAEEISNNEFAIAGGEPGMRVSWQVTGIRKDAMAKAMPVEIEQLKSAEDRGKFQNPEVFGRGVEDAVDAKNVEEHDLDQVDTQSEREER
ncbi:hypothetical protein KQH82_02985 [bacterium]|nr:hypothetical protein [bacterium]